jgi:hypothetical protein
LQNDCAVAEEHEDIDLGNNLTFQPEDLDVLEHPVGTEDAPEPRGRECLGELSSMPQGRLQVALVGAHPVERRVIKCLGDPIWLKQQELVWPLAYERIGIGAVEIVQRSESGVALAFWRCKRLRDRP